MKQTKPLLITLAVTAGLLAVVVASRMFHAPLAAKYWRGQLDTVPDQQAEEFLRSVAALGEPGIPVLVEALGAKREAVARAAEKLLTGQLDHWQTYRTSGSLRKQAILAEALAKHVESYRPTARGDAIRMALRMLDKIPEIASDERGRLIAACDGVLQASKVDRRSMPQENLALQTGPLPMSRNLSPAATARRELSGASEETIVELARSPGGGLLPPIVARSKRPAERIRVSPSLADGPSMPPGRFSSPQPINPLREPSRLSTSPDVSPLEPRTGNRLSREPSAERNMVRPLSWGPGGAQPERQGGRQPERPSIQVQAANTLDLMRQWGTGHQRTLYGVRTELTRRGFSATHLELARQMFSPDAGVRRRLVNQLPGIGDLNPTPWLMHLARDANAEVRLAALSLLATVGDPKLLETVEGMARADLEPRVQRIADNIARQRGRRPPGF